MLERRILAGHHGPISVAQPRRRRTNVAVANCPSVDAQHRPHAHGRAGENTSLACSSSSADISRSSRAMPLPRQAPARKSRRDAEQHFGRWRRRQSARVVDEKTRWVVGASVTKPRSSSNTMSSNPSRRAFNLAIIAAV